VVCGRGNNGGDGFVAARHLANAGAAVTVFLACPRAELKGDAAVFFAPLAPMGAPIVEAPPDGVGAAGPFRALRNGNWDLLADALLGTGARGAATGATAVLIEAVNAAAAGNGVPVVAADIPSGVEADTGNVEGPAVRATRTVTFALPKPGLLVYPGAEYVGRLTVADIGIPRALLGNENADLGMELTTRAWMRRVLPPRRQSRDANKGTFGTVLVIAGSAGMVGAAALAAVSALRAGAGLVQLAVPRSVLDTAAMLAPEVITRPLPETGARTHGGEGALDAALALAERADAVALGPGLGGNPEAAAFVQGFVRRCSRPLVVDADGLNALAGAPDAVRERPAADAETVLTPHPGEMGRLLRLDTAAAVQADRQQAAERGAGEYGAVVLLKGARTLLAHPDGRLALNRRGSPALATAGSGDVLTGVIAALLGQRMTAFDAARAGAYLHAVAGEEAERRRGAVGALAGDVRDLLPEGAGVIVQ
jgi:NAD(P)H-hydrate epimerase